MSRLDWRIEKIVSSRKGSADLDRAFEKFRSHNGVGIRSFIAMHLAEFGRAGLADIIFIQADTTTDRGKRFVRWCAEQTPGTMIMSQIEGDDEGHCITTPKKIDLAHAIDDESGMCHVAIPRDVLSHYMPVPHVVQRPTDGYVTAMIMVWGHENACVKFAEVQIPECVRPVCFS